MKGDTSVLLGVKGLNLVNSSASLYHFKFWVKYLQASREPSTIPDMKLIGSWDIPLSSPSLRVRVMRLAVASNLIYRTWQKKGFKCVIIKFLEHFSKNSQGTAHQIGNTLLESNQNSDGNSSFLMKILHHNSDGEFWPRMSIRIPC